jgi:hypothetical protein
MRFDLGCKRLEAIYQLSNGLALLALHFLLLFLLGNETLAVGCNLDLLDEIECFKFVMQSLTSATHSRLNTDPILKTILIQGLSSKWLKQLPFGGQAVGYNESFGVGRLGFLTGFGAGRCGLLPALGGLLASGRFAGD